jgi:hypothetical protein
LKPPAKLEILVESFISYKEYHFLEFSLKLFVCIAPLCLRQSDIKNSIFVHYKDLKENNQDSRMAFIDYLVQAEANKKDFETKLLSTFIKQFRIKTKQKRILFKT